MTKESERNVKINLIVPESMKEQLLLLVKKGKFATISEAVREAIRQMLQKYQKEISNPETTKNKK